MDKYAKMVLGLFIVVLALRLWLAFSNPHFTYDSYFHLRQAEHIKDTGTPLYNDPLSYGGRTTTFLPLYDYLLAGSNFVLPLETAAKIISNLLMALLVLLSFFMANEMTGNRKAAVLSALIAGFIPVAFETNSTTPTQLVLPLFFLALYSITKLKERKYHLMYIGIFTLLSLTSSLIGLLILGLVIYLIFSKIEDHALQPEEIEITLFSLFFFIWLQFLFFKRVLLEKGIDFLWQNIPSAIMGAYFQRLSIGEALLYLGILPLVAGFWVIYKNFQQKHHHITRLLTSCAVGILALLVVEAIVLKTALMFLGVVFAILFAQFYSSVEHYLHQTKIDRYEQWLSIGLAAFLLITSFSFSLTYAWQQETPTDDDILALSWVRNATPLNSTIASTVDEGHLAAYVAQRKNIMDSHFVGVGNVDERFKEVERLYTTKYQTEAIDILKKYQADYILFSEKAQRDYLLKKVDYIAGSCFRHVYKNTTQVYKRECTITEMPAS